MTRPRRVLLGVTGGIAAFKAARIVRRFREEGCEVRCAVTRAAEAFVAPLTLEVLSGAPIYREEYLSPGTRGEELHVSAAAWADTLCIAPATAHTLARLALGLADDFLTTTALTHDGPLVVAPAMHTEMWSKAAVRDNVRRLEERGAVIVGPVLGPLASGEVGLGRMAEPEEIVAAVVGRRHGALAGRRVLISAGPTREAVDPVRFLSNRSSGKMGFALAAAAAEMGAETTLVAGPVTLGTPLGVERLDVVSAVEMRDAVYRHAPAADLVIMAAAVSDFRPRDPRGEKIKKHLGLDQIKLEPNPDILAGLRDVAPRPLIVGFAAETHDLEAAARGKLTAKRADLLVANDVSRPDIGFDSDDNEVLVLFRDRESLSLPRRAKRLLAADLMGIFAEELDAVDAQGQPAAR